MDRHELIEFLKGANISVTQNSNSVQLPANPFEGDITAYVDGRFEEIQAHEAGKIVGSVMCEQDWEMIFLRWKVSSKRAA